MRFLYTGAKTYGDKQDSALLSLGGFISNTIVGNDKLNNIFSDISYLTFVNKSSECKGLILENETTSLLQNVQVGYKYPSNKIFKLEVAFVALNNTTPQQIEKIASAYDSPYYATFAEAEIAVNDSFDNSINIGNLTANGGRMAVWFKRSILQPATITDYYTYYKNLNDNPDDTTKKTQLILKYQINQ